MDSGDLESGVACHDANDTRTLMSMCDEAASP